MIHPLVTITHLASSIDDLGEKGLCFVDYFMTEGVLDCRVIAFDEMAFAILYS